MTFCGAGPSPGGFYWLEATSKFIDIEITQLFCMFSILILLMFYGFSEFLVLALLDLLLASISSGAGSTGLRVINLDFRLFPHAGGNSDGQVQGFLSLKM